MISWSAVLICMFLINVIYLFLLSVMALSLLSMVMVSEVHHSNPHPALLNMAIDISCDVRNLPDAINRGHVLVSTMECILEMHTNSHELLLPAHIRRRVKVGPIPLGRTVSVCRDGFAIYNMSLLGEFQEYLVAIDINAPDGQVVAFFQL